MMRISILILLEGILIFTGAFACALTPIQDPHQVLNQIRAFGPAESFEKTFGCYDQAQIQTFVISCSDYFANQDYGTMVCKSVADPKGLATSRQVTICSVDQISILTDLTGDMTNITRADFLMSHQNSAELFLNNLSDFTGYAEATLTLESAQVTPFTLARGTSLERKVEALTITGSFGEPGKFQFPLIITVLKIAPGVAQVARFRMDNKTWFLLQDFTKGQP